MLIMQHISRPASESSTYIALLDAPGTRSFVRKHDTYHYSLVSLVKSEVSRLLATLFAWGVCDLESIELMRCVRGDKKNFTGYLAGG